jgi:thioesterase domain-containing protein/acyl carrier protein
MPLYHIHGLVGGLLATLAAGGTVACPGEFDPGKFFDWMEQYQPTWYTAVPTIHQAILKHAPARRDTIARCALRLIRSSSAALPAPVMAELERVFGVPVIESYGMTEAAHQIASNPRPPRPRKAGSVGLPAGPEVGIVDESGAVVKSGETGEIVIRGMNVVEEAENFVEISDLGGRWFRTGDLGSLDGDGYLFIRGRIKEIINRGGAKVSPREVEEVLLEHPAVADAAVFGFAHVTLGEDVAAAVVLREGAAAGESTIRDFTLARLAPYKVPSQVIVVDEIPTGATGKLRRKELAERLAPVLHEDSMAPRDELEARLARIWEDTLGTRPVGVRDNFFALGGDSLLALQLQNRIEDATGRRFPPAALLHAPTVGQLAAILRQEGGASPWTSLVPINPRGTGIPLFCVHGAAGTVFLYRHLARHLGSEQPVYGLQAVGLDVNRPCDTRIEDMAARYIAEIRSVQPRGPYALAGICFGGLVAFEMAQQLHCQGHAVPLLAMFDAPARIPLLARVRGSLAHFMNSTLRERLAFLREKIRTRLTEEAWMVGLQAGRLFPGERTHTPRDVRKANVRASRDYVLRPYPGRVTVFRATETTPGYEDPRLGWGRFARGGVDVYEVPGNHSSLVEEPHVQALASKVKRLQWEIQAGEWVGDGVARPASG